MTSEPGAQSKIPGFDSISSIQRGYRALSEFVLLVS